MASALWLVALCALAGLASGQPAPRAFAPDSCIEKVPPPPRELKGRAVNDSAITVTWRAPVTDACIDTYNYYVVEGANAPQPRSLPKQTSRPSYSLTVVNLKPNTDYTVFVSSVNSQKGSSPPAPLTVRTAKTRCTIFNPRRPGPVSDISFVQTSPRSATVSWLPPSDGCVTGYRIETFDPSGRRIGLPRYSIDADDVQITRPNTFYDVRVTPLFFLLAGPTTRATLTTGSVMARPGRRMAQ